MAFLKNIFDTRKILDDKRFLTPVNHIELCDIKVWYGPRMYFTKY